MTPLQLVLVPTVYPAGPGKVVTTKSMFMSEVLFDRVKAGGGGGGRWGGGVESTCLPFSRQAPYLKVTEVILGSKEKL